MQCTVNLVASLYRLGQPGPPDFVIRCPSVSPSQHLSEWLKAECGIKNSLGTISSLLKTPRLLVLDRADHIITKPEGRDFFTALAEECRDEHKLNIVAAVTDPDLAATVLGWNGGRSYHSWEDPIPSICDIQMNNVRRHR